MCSLRRPVLTVRNTTLRRPVLTVRSELSQRAVQRQVRHAQRASHTDTREIPDTLEHLDVDMPWKSHRYTTALPVKKVHRWHIRITPGYQRNVELSMLVGPLDRYLAPDRILECLPLQNRPHQ